KATFYHEKDEVRLLLPRFVGSEALSRLQAPHSARARQQPGRRPQVGRRGSRFNSAPRLITWRGPPPVVTMLLVEPPPGSTALVRLKNRPAKPGWPRDVADRTRSWIPRRRRVC